MDSLEDRVKAFFTKCKTSAPPLKKEEKDEQFLKMREVRNRSMCCSICLDAYNGDVDMGIP